MNILLVDLTNISYRFVDRPIQRDTKIVDTVMSFAKSFNADRIICAKDSTYSSFRKTRYPKYKEHRVINLTTEEKEKRTIFYNDINKASTLLKHIDIPVLEYPDIEADDIICWLSTIYPTATLLSGDYDLTQLDLEQFSPFKSSYISYKEYGCDNAQQYITAKAIAGDTADNIDGVYGIGIKTAVNILKKYNCNTIDELEPQLKLGKKLGKREQSILDNISLIKDNLYLVDLKLVNNLIITEEVKQNLKEFGGINEYNS